MSIYIDVKSSKWFNTRAELRAFQRGGAIAPPLFVSEEVEATEGENQQGDEPEVEVEADDATETEYNEYGVSITDKGIFVAREKEEMITELKEAGIDGRTLRGKDKDQIAHLYAKRFGINA